MTARLAGYPYWVTAVAIFACTFAGVVLSAVLGQLIAGHFTSHSKWVGPVGPVVFALCFFVVDLNTGSNRPWRQPR